MRCVRCGAAFLGLLASVGPASAQLFIGSSRPGAGFGYSHQGPSFSISVWRSYGFAGPPSIHLPPVAHPALPLVVYVSTPPTLVVVPGLRNRVDEVLDLPPIPPLPALPNQAAPAPAPPRRPPAPPRDPPAEPPLPRVVPEADPRAENARLTRLGQQAFAAREYGRAENRFRRATEVLPDDAQAYFLLAQARLALGMYREAVAAIESGVRRKPDWPRLRFRPREMYEGNAADFAEHLRDLDAALVRFPDDPFLLFLAAYSTWFDGRQDEALPRFRRALEQGADAATVERFLR